MLTRIHESFKFRQNLAKFGIYHFLGKNIDVSNLVVRNKRIRLTFPESEKKVLEYELGSILIGDCYGLKTLSGKINTVLDVGANIGLFSVAASHYFPKAIIHAYEPNADLEQYLSHNCSVVGAKFFFEAVGLEDSLVTLSKQENSLHTVTVNTRGSIPCIALRKTLQKLGNPVDLVKLDCEGAEWDLFNDVEAWSNVRYLTMEYHLWALPNSTFDDLLSRIENIGFCCTYHAPSSNQWGIIQAYNKRFQPQ